MTTLETIRSGHVVIGIDTHKHIHVAAVMDTVGGILATLTIATDTGGFKQLLEWATTFGQIIAFGVEGTGSYGATLTSFLRRHGHKVVEAGRPDRRLRRVDGKSDTLDAENAARSVLAGFATVVPKTADGEVEMIRQLKIAHDSAVTERSAAMVTMKAMLVHANDELRACLDWHAARADELRGKRRSNARWARALATELAGFDRSSQGFPHCERGVLRKSLPLLRPRAQAPKVPLSKAVKTCGEPFASCTRSKSDVRVVFQTPIT